MCFRTEDCTDGQTVLVFLKPVLDVLFVTSVSGGPNSPFPLCIRQGNPVTLMRTASVPFKSKFQWWIYFFRMPTPLPLGLQRQILVFFCRPQCLHLGFKPSRIDLWGPEAAPSKESWRHLHVRGCRGSAVPWRARGQRLALLPAL